MDSHMAHNSFDTMHPKPFELICFHAQQSAEKLLKGFLTVNAITPPKTHDLLILHDMCLEIREDFEPLRLALGRLNPYGVQPRYPNEIEIAEKDTLQALMDMDLVMMFFNSCIFST
jgi:HEPN domain-containing protein